MQKKRYPRVLFRKRLNDLREEVGKMGETTIEAYKNAILVFSSYDEDLVKKVTKAHEKIDKMNYHLEHDAMGVIAAEQPVARDLRFIEACVKVGGHLKRMGNLSFNIAEVARHIKDEEIPQKPMNDLKDMADIVEKMVSKSLTTFLEQDMDLARELHHDDDMVDDLFDKALQDITKSMFQEKDAISYMVYILFVARFLERIADRAENIGDRTIFMLTCEKP
ncbi:phosphate signaling complex protein PhoU [Methanobacterium paludis]|uniref:Phosphate-specific transport system accessory protein PhoU n=1 Tax=Methanobacterium paludis (strain DSM 25820 / JCM 18151 / SWAN1) TaxID=868131 RepID=F6D6A0_METPW|nr:phosphate signaling complex protein PhoU [Methanobacterium paludis]AEG18921.1 phosphate uptake regulator, PhoU [Methanobacterium paludis]